MRAIIFYFVPLIFISISIQSQSLENIWESEKVFRTPESVFYNVERNQVYVANINGKPTDKDNNGFISLLDTTGKIISLKWVTGMHAPKGMTVVDNLLYVSDIDRFHIIDLDDAKIIKTVNVENALFLNDIAANSDSSIFISDMSKGHIVKFDGKNVEIWLSDEQMIKPNGLAFFKEHLFVGTKNKLLKVDITEKKIKVLIEETGPIDGLLPIGGNKFIISDWSGRIMLVSPTQKFVLSNTTEQNIQAADLGFIPDTEVILIPTFFDNRVIASKLNK